MKKSKTNQNRFSDFFKLIDGNFEMQLAMIRLRKHYKHKMRNNELDVV